MSPPATQNGFLRGGVRIKHVPSYYSSEQAALWLAAIGYTPSLTTGDLEAGKFVTSLESLRVVQRLHQIAFTFENTAMHYTENHTVEVGPEEIFHRLVVEGKGSYCFGQNTVLLGMLRRLGFRCYGASGRCNVAHPSSVTPSFTALYHMMLLVQPGGDVTTYISDVGYGGSGLTRPMLLSDDEGNVQYGFAPCQRHRLVRGALPHSSLEYIEGTNAGSYHWNLEVSDETVDSRWRNLYVFSEDEFHALDFESGSYAFHSSPVPAEGQFWGDVIAAKYFLLSDEEEEAMAARYPNVPKGDNVWTGRLTLGRGVVKRVLGDKVEVVVNLKDDLERVRCLREQFGVPLKDEDAKHIAGRASELKTKA